MSCKFKCQHPHWGACILATTKSGENPYHQYVTEPRCDLLIRAFDNKTSLSSRFGVNPLIVDSINQENIDTEIKDLLIDLIRHEIMWDRHGSDPAKEFKKEYPKMIDRYCPFEEQA